MGILHKGEVIRDLSHVQALGEGYLVHPRGAIGCVVGGVQCGVQVCAPVVGVCLLTAEQVTLAAGTLVLLFIEE